MPNSQTVYIAAAIINRPDGKTLLVRKQGTSAFMQAGGKIEADEEQAAALCRELSEELGLEVDIQTPKYIGRFEAPAANEPGWVVQAEMFVIETTSSMAPAAEIAEIIWVDPKVPEPVTLAPFTRNHILPFCRAGH